MENEKERDVGLAQQIRRKRVDRVALEDGAQQLAAGGGLAESEPGLRLEEERGGELAGLQVVVEQQHRRQRRGKVVDLRRLAREVAGVGEQRAQELLCGRSATELLQ